MLNLLKLLGFRGFAKQTTTRFEKEFAFVAHQHHSRVIVTNVDRVGRVVALSVKGDDVKAVSKVAQLTSKRLGIQPPMLAVSKKGMTVQFLATTRVSLELNVKAPKGQGQLIPVGRVPGETAWAHIDLTNTKSIVSIGNPDDAGMMFRAVAWSAMRSMKPSQVCMVMLQQGSRSPFDIQWQWGAYSAKDDPHHSSQHDAEMSQWARQVGRQGISGKPHLIIFVPALDVALGWTGHSNLRRPLFDLVHQSTNTTIVGLLPGLQQHQTTDVWMIDHLANGLTAVDSSAVMSCPLQIPKAKLAGSGDVMVSGFGKHTRVQLASVSTSAVRQHLALRASRSISAGLRVNLQALVNQYKTTRNRLVYDFEIYQLFCQLQDNHGVRINDHTEQEWCEALFEKDAPARNFRAVRDAMRAIAQQLDEDREGDEL